MIKAIKYREGGMDYLVSVLSEIYLFYFPLSLNEWQKLW